MLGSSQFAITDTLFAKLPDKRAAERAEGKMKRWIALASTVVCTVALIAVAAASASARICLYQATAEALEAGLRE